MQPPPLDPAHVAELISTAKWVVGGMFTGIAATVAFLLKIAYSMGGHVAELKAVAKDMTGIKTHADKVPVLETRVGTLESVFQRQRSDIEELRRRGALRPPSVPEIDPGGE